MEVKSSSPVEEPRPKPRVMGFGSERELQGGWWRFVPQRWPNTCRKAFPRRARVAYRPTTLPLPLTRRTSPTRRAPPTRSARAASRQLCPKSPPGGTLQSPSPRRSSPASRTSTSYSGSTTRPRVSCSDLLNEVWWAYWTSGRPPLSTASSCARCFPRISTSSAPSFR